MIRDLVPAGVIVVDDRTPVTAAALLPEEAAIVERAVEKRRREFAAGRHCARQALARLGMSPVAILPGKGREPVWPTGVVGSITHCAGYCAAAVAREREFVALGIDVELHRPLPAGVFELTAREDERAHIATLGAGRVCWDCVLFSAKESLYKAWFPIAHAWLGFQDVALTFVPDRGTFAARLLVADPLVDDLPFPTIVGRFAVDEGYVATAVVIPRQ